MSGYAAIIVGTGFAGTFFLHRFLERAPANARVLVLERGLRYTREERVAHKMATPFDVPGGTHKDEGDAAKPWLYRITFGGTSNAWWGNVPRMLPNDFRTQTKYGVGRDWPVDYDQLEPYYSEVERLMAVAGSDDMAVASPRSTPYPQPPHRITDPELLLKAKYPEHFFAMPSARARIATDTRTACCANSLCHACPIDAKFMVANDLASPYADPRVDLQLEAEVTGVETSAGIATGVVYQQGGRERRAAGDMVVLAANGIFNPAILQMSGIEHPQLGVRLHEQVSLNAYVFLDGVDNFQGSTSVTGAGFMLADGDFRAERAPVLIETWNRPRLRTEPGKWRQLMPIRLVVEDLPLDSNRVEVPPGQTRPNVIFNGISNYASRSLARAQQDLETVFDGLPVERIEIEPEPNPTEGHIQGATVMGNNPADSVVNAELKMHSHSNLLVLGSSVFPTGPVANPTLTLSALAMRAADYV